MKISALFATIALAQDERAMSLDKKIENAQNKCGVFMDKALVCEPPSEKIGKYTFRLDKVLLDAKHHLKVGKCDPMMDGGYAGGYRRRRETLDELNAEFDAVMEEIAQNDDDAFTGKQYGSSASQGQLNKLQGLCERFIKQVFNDDSLADCPKLGAWQNRSSALFADMVAMKNVCLKQADEAAAADAGGAAAGGGAYAGDKPSKPAPTAAPSKPNKPSKPANNNYNAGGNKPKKPKKPSKKPNNKY
jgi:hypothetical protein